MGIFALRETRMRIFFVICEIHIYFRVTFEPTTFAGIFFFSLLRDSSVSNAPKLHQTRCETCPFDELAVGGLRTNHSNSNLEGLKSAIMDKRLGTNLHFCAYIRRKYNLPYLTSPPLQQIVENYYLQLLLIVNIVLEGREKATRF